VTFPQTLASSITHGTLLLIEYCLKRKSRRLLFILCTHSI
jgi:hypothetical protein